MPTVSEQLRQGREAKNLTVHQIAEITKIKTEHVRALENGNFEVFTAPIYIRGFVRSYGNAVGLDPQKLTKDLEAELALTENLSGPPSLSGPRRGLLDKLMFFLSQLNWRIVLPLGIVVVLVVVGVWGYRAAERRKAYDPAAELGPGLFQPDPDTTGEVLPFPTNSVTPVE
jgi:cytoskeletal protein RodZ